MYIQITTRCNMCCAHCCFACGAIGEDMPRDIFLAACHLANSRGDIIMLGGGEPTIHPYFWEYLGLALAYSEDVPYIVTNGKETETCLRLAALMKKGVIGAEVSQDKYHERIDSKVITAFGTHIRSVKSVIKQGRGAGIQDSVIDCCCQDLFVDVGGNIYSCGCKVTNYGTVTVNTIPDDWDDYANIHSIEE